MNRRRNRPKPEDYDREAYFVDAILRSLDPRPITKNRISRWALRRIYPEVGLLIATIAVDAAAEWRNHHGERA